MDRLQRVTAATVDVLRVLLTAGTVWGLQVIKQSGRPPGTVYPVLDRLEQAGWLVSEWETDAGRSGPRRRYYRLTADGAAEAQRVIAGFDARSRQPRTSSRPAGAAL